MIGLLIGKSFQNEPLILSNYNNQEIKIKPNSILKVNGKMAQYNGLDKLTYSVYLTFDENENVERYNFNQIKKIHLQKKASLFLKSKEHASKGFKNGIFLSKIFSMVAIYFIKKRQDNDYSELTKNERTFAFFLMAPPI